MELVSAIKWYTFIVVQALSEYPFIPLSYIIFFKSPLILNSQFERKISTFEFASQV